MILPTTLIIFEYGMFAYVSNADCNIGDKYILSGLL